MDARRPIESLRLERHPEGGWFRETWRAEAAPGVRSAGTAIHHLLEAGDVSHGRPVDAAGIWRFYAGAPLSLTVSPNGHDAEAGLLGPEVAAGQRPQRLAPAGRWRCAASMGAWTLAGRTVSPGFDFAGFELAPPDWRPVPRSGG
jgi:predicted cupin superfamily sugar epimerase